MKDIDNLQKRSRKLRDFAETTGSSGLAFTGLVGLLFLSILVWQITAPTFIDGENGEIPATNEFITVSDYKLEWDYPNTDSNGSLTTDAIVLEISWAGGDEVHELQINIIPERNVYEDVYINQSGLSTNFVEIGRKTKFHLYSSLTEVVEVKQKSGPVPSADETGKPLVSSSVIEYDVALLYDEGLVFEPLEIVGYITLIFLIFVYRFPKKNILELMAKLVDKRRTILGIFYLLAFVTIIAGGFSVSSTLAALCWILAARMTSALTKGIERMLHSRRKISEISKLKHSISNRDGLLMWSSILLVASTLFIPLEIYIPFLTERNQEIFSPYSSGIRVAFYGSIWVMLIAMISSVPISVGAAIYLEEYSKPTKTTKLIQALVTNLAGVPSIVFGMFGLAIFVKQGGIGLGLGPSILAAGLTMGVMAMPIIVLASQEALRSVPRSLRESAYGVGCTQWQVTKDHVLPSAMPGIMTGSILAMSRIMGEAAPLVVVGATAMILFDPEPLAGLLGGNVNFTVIPIQIYFWTSEPDPAWHAMAAAASISLIALLVAMNSIAIVLRQHFRRRLN
ncbi:MAG: phosphate ABC transporter, permease protein PstA [Halieaceae bacterium]|nr:phosphate ABC transporter, permease protein PstA [Halieaceae bacterium]|tara:strand:- start:2716 stop:4413 length:1698 start_codon:yes stop_codon:yes gene_type:complete